MRSRAVGQRPAHAGRPIYIVGVDSGERSDLQRHLSESGVRYPVEVVPVGSLPERSATPAGVVCVAPSEPTAPRGDGAGDSGAVRGRSELSRVVERAAAAGVDCPVITVGAGVDAAAAYEAGATDIVPVDVATHGDVAAERIRAIVERAGGQQLLNDIVNRAGDGIVVRDPETGEMLAYNDRFCRILGYDPANDELTLSDVVEADDVVQNVNTPRNLTDIGIGFKRAFDRFDERGVERVRFGLLSLSIILSHVDQETVCRFCRTLTRGISQEGAVGFFLLNRDAHGSGTVTTLSRAFDGVLAVEDAAEGQRVRLPGIDGIAEEWRPVEN